MCTLDAIEEVIIRAVHCWVKDVVLLASFDNLQQNITCQEGLYENEGENETPKLYINRMCIGEVFSVCPAACFTLQVPHTFTLL